MVDAKKQSDQGDSKKNAGAQTATSNDDSNTPNMITDTPPPDPASSEKTGASNASGARGVGLHR